MPRTKTSPALLSSFTSSMSSSTIFSCSHQIHRHIITSSKSYFPLLTTPSPPPPYTHTHTHTHIHTHTHTHTHTKHTHTRTHARTHARTHHNTHTHTRALTHSLTRSLTHARTHAHTNTHTHYLVSFSGKPAVAVLEAVLVFGMHVPLGYQAALCAAVADGQVVAQIAHNLRVFPFTG